MDELLLYITAGDPTDKHAQESLGAVASVQKSQVYTTFRNAECPINGAALTGFGAGERLFVAGKDKALITCYAWGKETPDQRFPVPEQMSCLAVAHFPNTGANTNAESTPLYRVPWLLVAGLRLGKLYVWELALGDLVCVKDAHYQQILTMQFSPCGTFLVTGGEDTRVNVWRTLDLATPDVAATCKPHATFTDHALGISGVDFALGAVASDLRVATSARDGTLRVYDVVAKTLLTTFVFLLPVECLARDPAGRAYYVGLADGTIRQAPMYSVNPYTHVLEAVGGTGKIITVDADANLTTTFLHHKTETGGYATAMRVSMDGMSLISGDTLGRTFVADIVTKQVVKAYTACKSAIAHVHLGVCSQAPLAHGSAFEKRHRLLPPLKRVLTSGVLAEHALTMQLASAPEQQQDFAAWLDCKAQEEFEFKKSGGAKSESDAASSTVNTGASAQDLQDLQELQEKLNKVSAAYSSLKDTYDDLLQAHEARE